MSYNQVILLLGTNLGDKKLNIKTACAFIDKEIGAIKKKSEIIETEPLGFDSVNIFFNQTVVVKTQLSPVQLLHKVKSIEKNMGRTYSSDERYQDRIIDIDILKFNEIIFESKLLLLPHHQIDSRNFVKTILKF